MDKKTFGLVAGLVLAAVGAGPAHGIGLVAHMEIAERARRVYVLDPAASCGGILRRHLDAFRAGAVFPDWGFVPSKPGGPSIHPDAAEAAHWTPFFQAAAEYLRGRPKPWDEGNDRSSGQPPLGVTADQIVKASTLEAVYCLVFRQAEGSPALRKLVDGLYLPFFADRSRFLMEQFQSYPSGGADDSAALTAFSWPSLAKWFDQPPAGPVLPAPALHCPPGVAADGTAEAAIPAEPPLVFPEEIQGAMRELAGHLKARFVPGGVLLSLPEAGRMSAAPLPKGPIYAYLGSSVALDGDLLVAGAPGYSLPGRPQVGAVLIRRGGPVEGRIGPAPELLRPGTEAYARFGQAVALPDLNADGRADLAVSAPDSGVATLAHRGRVFVYFGREGGGFPGEPDLTLEGEEDQGRFGWTLTAADCDGDGFADLIAGTSFAAAADGGRQGGRVAVYLASPANRPGGRPQPAWVGRGERANDGFGSAVAVGGDGSGRRVLAVGAPGVKAGDRAGVGRIYGYTLSWPAGPSPLFTLTGNRRFARLGAALALGSPRRKGELLLAAGSPTDEGTRTQAGAAVLLPVAALKPGQSIGDVTPVLRVRGSQAYARFGWRLALADADGDGMDDLLASEPLRATAAGAGAGAAYGWFGGARFPAGEAAPEGAPWKAPSKERRAWMGGALAVRPGRVAVGVERSSADALLGGALVTFAPHP